MSRNPFLDVSEFPAAPPPSKEVNGLTADIFVSEPDFPCAAAMYQRGACIFPVTCRFV
jgi:hypothetical protein